MGLRILHADYPEVADLRERYRAEARCQVVHDSVLPRGLADPYLVLAGGRVAGYAGVWNKYHEGRIMELYIVPTLRPRTRHIVEELLQVSGATQIEAQTNMPHMLATLREWTDSVVEEKLLFEDDHTTRLPCPAGALRQATEHDGESRGEWLIDVNGQVVAGGGVLHHYNPPYGDIYMEVSDSERRKGFGSYLVQELKRICHESGKRPAARCDPSNRASRRTLERAGFVTCGWLLAGEIRPL